MMMKISAFVTTFLLSSLSLTVSAAGHADQCTHGMLFVTDADSSMLRAIALDGDSLSNLNVTTSIDLQEEIAPTIPEFHLKSTADTSTVAIIYRGQLDLNYSDGAVRFVDTGVSLDAGDVVSTGQLTMVDNAGFDCHRAIHYVRHDNKIAIFCDGMLNNVTQVNSTIWVLDEMLINDPTAESAIIYTHTLQGSHHGVAIPVDDGHILYSLATSERSGGNYSMSSLPATFQVTDYEGNVMHTIADTSNVDTSCAGFHGEWGHHGTFALGCGDEHGGILVVNYNATDETYTSRALMYPEEYSGHRTGSFAEHHLAAPTAVGNFANGSHYHLMSFSVEDDALAADQVTPLPARQCSFIYEMGSGQHLLVFLPNGQMYIYDQVAPMWNLVANVTVVEGMQDCSETIEAVGFGQAFVMVTATQTLYTLDLEHINDVDGGYVDVYTTQLDFTPYSAVVAGVPPGTGCKMHHAHDEHDDHDDHGDEGHDHGDDTSMVAEGEGMHDDHHDHGHSFELQCQAVDSSCHCDGDVLHCSAEAGEDLAGILCHCHDGALECSGQEGDSHSDMLRRGRRHLLRQLASHSSGDPNGCHCDGMEIHCSTNEAAEQHCACHEYEGAIEVHCDAVDDSCHCDADVLHCSAEAGEELASVLCDCSSDGMLACSGQGDHDDDDPNGCHCDGLEVHCSSNEAAEQYCECHEHEKEEGDMHDDHDHDDHDDHAEEGAMGDTEGHDHHDHDDAGGVEVECQAIDSSCHCDGDVLHCSAAAGEDLAGILCHCHGDGTLVCSGQEDSHKHDHDPNGCHCDGLEIHCSSNEEAEQYCECHDHSAVEIGGEGEEAVSKTTTNGSEEVSKATATTTTWGTVLGTFSIVMMMMLW